MSKRNLPMHRQMLVTNEGEELRALVRCPHQNVSIDAHTECADCARLISLEWDASGARGGRVVCDVPAALEEKAKIGIGVAPTLKPFRPADIGEAAIRSTVRDLVVGASRDARSTTFAIAISADLAVERVRELFAGKRGLRSVPVVDDAGKLLGILSRSDLVLRESEITETTTAGDIMPKCIHALPEDAPLSYAIALMASENVSEVPIVTDEGVVLGMCHALDVIRWLAKEIGYVLDPPADGSSGNPGVRRTG